MFLIMPVQRIPRYSLLLNARTPSSSLESPFSNFEFQSLKDYTDPIHPDYQNICDAASEIKKVALAVDAR